MKGLSVFNLNVKCSDKKKKKRNKHRTENKWKLEFHCPIFILLEILKKGMYNMPCICSKVALLLCGLNKNEFKKVE